MIITLFILFFIKHYICDFPLQRWPYQYTNKGTYGHAGGIIHSTIHGLYTFIILYDLTPLALVLAATDMIIHYHVDWAKMKIGAKYNLKPDNSEWYWHLLGLDQLLHYLTYAGIIWVVVK